MNDDYPLRIGHRQLTGPAKYLAVVIVLTLAALLYVGLSRWLRNRSVEDESGLYEEFYTEGSEFD